MGPAFYPRQDDAVSLHGNPPPPSPYCKPLINLSINADVIGNPSYVTRFRANSHKSYP